MSLSKTMYVLLSFIYSSNDTQIRSNTKDQVIICQLDCTFGPFLYLSLYLLNRCVYWVGIPLSGTCDYVRILFEWKDELAYSSILLTCQCHMNKRIMLLLYFTNKHIVYFAKYLILLILWSCMAYCIHQLEKVDNNTKSSNKLFWIQVMTLQIIMYQIAYN